jgi:hypothetical protein
METPKRSTTALPVGQTRGSDPPRQSILIRTLWLTQRKTSLDKVASLIDEMPFRQPITLARCEDGELEVWDGHHRLTAWFIAGRDYLYYGEYIIVEAKKSRKRFGRMV